MNINKKIVSILEGINVPVKYLRHTGQEKTYITFFEYLRQPERYSEDKREIVGRYIQIDLWSDRPNLELIDQIIEKLDQAEIEITEIEDLYEKDIELYHTGIRVIIPEYKN